jgi:hypothetical protein
VQGGDPVWDGETLPFVLPTVTLDTSSADCAGGWNYTDSLATALKIGRFWPTGRPNVCLEVAPSADAIVRGDKHRCSQLTILRRVELAEVRLAIGELSEVFGLHADAMADSQLAWFVALGRPQALNEQRIEDALRDALAARGLDWQTKRFDNAWGARTVSSAPNGVTKSVHEYGSYVESAFEEAIYLLYPATRRQPP